ncbi:hypothetical protein NFI96_022287, partial [Prochilodus magdalenae]
SLVNKMDEIRLRITSNNMNSCVVIITETWLNRSVPDAAIELAGHSIYRADRTEASGKSRGGVKPSATPWTVRPHFTETDPSIQTPNLQDQASCRELYECGLRKSYLNDARLL